MASYKLLFTDPMKYFSGISKMSYSDTLGLIFRILFIPYLLYFILSFGFDLGFSNLVIASAVLFALFTVLAAPFINAAVTHLGVLLFKKKGYKKTFLASSHAILAFAPYALVFVALALPSLFSQGIGVEILLILGYLVVFAGAIHILVLEIIGLKKLHKLSTGKAVVCALVIPLLISMVIAFLIGIMLVVIAVIAYSAVPAF